MIRKYLNNETKRLYLLTNAKRNALASYGDAILMAQGDADAHLIGLLRKGDHSIGSQN